MLFIATECYMCTRYSRLRESHFLGHSVVVLPCSIHSYQKHTMLPNVTEHAGVL